MGKPREKPEAETSDSSNSESESEQDIIVVLEPKPKSKSRHKHRVTKKAASKNLTDSNLAGYDENGNLLVDTARQSRSEQKKEKVLEVVHPVKIKHCESKPEPILEGKYSRATETEYRKAFGVKPPDHPFIPKQYLLRTPRVIERNKSCLDLKADSETNMVWTTTYLQDFTFRIKGEDEELVGAGLPTPKYTYVLPKRTRSKEKKCFDDDEDANPALRNFINSISRK